MFGLEVGRTGLTETEARDQIGTVAVSTVTGTDHAHYYPNAEPTTVKLIADAHTRRLLGGQVTGRSGVAGRTNILATALHTRMTVDELSQLDLGYAPPFAPVWDPVLIAANKLRSSLH